MSSSSDYLTYYLWKRRRIFKKYLNACECLQIDPSVIYSDDYIEHRANQGLSVYSNNESILKKYNKNARWLMNNYYRCFKFGYSFDKYCAKLVQKGILIVDVNEEAIENKDITTNWLSCWKKYKWKNFGIICCVCAGVVLSISLILAFTLNKN
ncbi:MAG: hypothetical protein FWF56_05565 [Firmicutes bacterium]|nr:hypothetical protein [Bacillota bacterium]MCL1953222.1 hypothetical protein [Bacillota bacterium]